MEVQLLSCLLFAFVFHFRFVYVLTHDDRLLAILWVYHIFGGVLCIHARTCLALEGGSGWLLIGQKMIAF